MLVYNNKRPDLNPIQNLWQGLKIAAQSCSPPSVTELELLCTKEWAKLVETYPRRHAAVIVLTKGGCTQHFLVFLFYFLFSIFLPTSHSCAILCGSTNQNPNETH